MSGRIFQRLPINAAFAARRTPVSARFNSSTSTSSAARIVEMARSAEKPSPIEASVPAMWAVSGALCLLAWNRASERKEDHVEKLLIV
ncbi:hypothetical protein B0J11DRAFT_577114 [Dendryphion nanum]|uniref:Uncharacterized protein n=1 Tax=Dendryphion nanum TaxID=256645 RepID=A0A9P9E6X1_9PLEO|nr:hypothetical protein B0J11DRAFT_577114 [Dendryphion nanum]